MWKYTSSLIPSLLNSSTKDEHPTLMATSALRKEGMVPIPCIDGTVVS
jgi:hypothetical protein